MVKYKLILRMVGLSQWGRLLLDEVEKTCAEQDSAVAWSIGGAGLFIKTSSTCLLIDPFLGQVLRATGSG